MIQNINKFQAVETVGLTEEHVEEQGKFDLIVFRRIRDGELISRSRFLIINDDGAHH